MGMKKTEFKALIKEAMMEILPDLMEIMVENMNTIQPVVVENSVRQTPDLTLIRQHAADARGEQGYDGLPKPPVDTPKNEKAIVDGEVFASGKGIMEWFAGKKAAGRPQSGFAHSPDQMDDFIAKKFGVK